MENGRFTTADYSCAFNALYCSLIIVDNEGHIVCKNESSKRLVEETGVSYEEILASFSSQIDLVKGQGRFSMQNGENWIICHVYPWLRAGGRNGSILVLHESGHEVCSQQELDIVNTTFREMNAILESATDGIIVTDRQGIIVRVNAAIEKTFGVDRRSLLGYAADEIVSKGIFKEAIVKQVLESKKRVTVSSDFKDKMLVYTGIPICDSHKRLTSVVVNIQDVSALNLLRQSLEQEKLKVRQMVVMNIEKNGDLIVNSSKMKQTMEKIRIISDVDSIVLVTGESGTGKEVIVNEIYRRSRRNGKAFVKINCGAIPDSLFESELFGYESGSFTGARHQGKLGFFELADKGTLLLDEVGELSLAAQVKLLRVIQEKEVLRIGAAKPKAVDVRIIAATNRNLWEMVKEGTFRQDLYYRLNVIQINVPPLRERREDIIPLTRFFIEKFNKRYHKRKKLSIDLARVLINMNWYGNTRELENVIETMIVLTPSDLLMPKDLPDKYTNEREAAAVTVAGIIPLQDALRETERQLLANARMRYKTTREIANALKVNQSTVSRKLRELDITLMH